MKIADFYRSSVAKLKQSNIKTAELDVKILLKFVLENDEAFLLLHPQMPLTNYQFTKLKKLLKRRQNGEPIAYLTGHKEFFGHDFLVNRNVLIPRPESEFLVETALDFFKLKAKSKRLKALDMGTGSGCIIISIAKELLTFNFQLSTKLFASDISLKALNVARKNADKHGARKEIRFFHSDLFGNRLLHKKYHLIIANLPYVPIKSSNSKLRTPNSDGITFEPASAIFADDNGTAIIKKFLTEAKKYLNKNGQILIELDPRNALEIHKKAQKLYPDAKIELRKDLSGRDRYIILEN